MRKIWRVSVPPDVMFDGFEPFLDFLADSMGNPLLMDIRYKAVAVDDGNIAFEVSGDDSERDPGAKPAWNAQPVDAA